MIHLPHPAIVHLPVATVLVIFLHNLFSLPTTTTPPPLPASGQATVQTFSLHYKFLNRYHTSFLLAYEDGTDTVFRNVGI
jgi:hypothetical protein